MAVSVTCPGCGTNYPVTDELVGKTIRCKKCQETFVARAAKSTVTAARGDERITTKPTAKATVREVFDDEDDAPRTNGKHRPMPVKKPAKKGGNTPLIVGGSLAGVLILGLGGALVWALNRGPDDSNAQANNVVAPVRPKLGTDLPDAPVETKPKEEPKPVEQPKAVQGKIEIHNTLPGFERRRRPADFDPVMVDRVKKSAVMILATGAEASGWGSAWVAEAEGDTRIIVTNAHVLHMKERAKSAPDDIKVYFHAGTDDETILEARPLAIDHDEDLAVIRVKGRDKKGNPLPGPFKISPSYDLVNGQKIMTLGFPHGGNLAYMGGQDKMRVEVKTRPSAVVGRIPNLDGSIKYIQVEGGIDGGNSGGGVIDTNGDICAVVVAELRGSNIKFVIPSEYAYHLLMGRILKVIPGQAVKSGSTIKMPLRAHIADPMKRITRVTGEVWAGKPGKVRTATTTKPDAVVGDGPRVTVDLTHKTDNEPKLGEPYITNGEVSLPPLKDGEVYWFQPHYVAKDGKDRWGEAIPMEMGRYPVEAKGANLTVKHKASSGPDDRRALELTSRQIIGIEGMGGQDQHLEASLSERIKSIEKNGDAKVSYQYADVRYKDNERDSAIRGRYKGLLESVKWLKSEAVVTKDGEFKSAKPDLAQVPKAAWGMMYSFDAQIMESLEALSIKLPNKEVQPGESWGVEGHYSYNLGRTTQNAVIKSSAKYIGSRVRDGREEAVVEFTGTVDTDPNARGGNPEGGGGRRGGDGDDSRGGQGESGRGGDDTSGRRRGIQGIGHGAALIDIQTGLVICARIEADMAARFRISLPTQNGGRTDVDIHAGLYQDSFGRRSLTKDKPPTMDPEKLLPNQVRTYNPLVGAADPQSVAAPPANDIPSSVDVPDRVTLMKPAAMEKAQKAAVMISVTTAQGGGEGSGWFAEPGIVMTNCHVVDMLTPTDRKPQKIEVYLDRGTPTERKLDGELLAIDRKDDLAVIRVKGDNLPEPFKIVPSAALLNAEQLMIHGFPRGSSLARGLAQGLGGRDYQTTLKSRPTTVTGRINKEDGSIRYVQLEGGADPGNSGGPITDANGNVRLVLVAGIPGTQLVFAIPGEYPARMLQGYPMELKPSHAYYDSSNVAKQPISIMFADPLKRLKKVWVDCWVGSPGKPRQGSDKEPKPKPGDGPRTTFEVPFAPDKSGLFMEVKSEIPIPPISPGQIYYFQPRFINGTGEMQWGQALPFAPDGPPVRHDKAELFVKHVKNAAPRYMELTSSMSHAVAQMGRQTDGIADDLTATYAETVQSLTAKKDALTDLKCVNFSWSALDDDFFKKYPELEQFFDPEIIKLLKQVLGIYKTIITKATFGADGHMWDKYAAAFPGGIPLAQNLLIQKFHEQMMLSLGAVCIPLPNKTVPYGHEWTRTTNLFVPAAKRYESGVFEMKMKYIGVRDRGGRKEAVIEITGNLARDKAGKSVEIKTKPEDTPKPEGGTQSTPFQTKPKAPPKDDPNEKQRPLYGVGHGHAYFDIDGGYISECELYVDLEVEMMVKDKETGQSIPQMVNGVMQVGLKRMNTPGKPK